jgi:SAM-dependent methyltransferase
VEDVGVTHWYHSIELSPGVVTPGQVDHRPIASRVLPADLRGLRALDVGTFDGFWAFELERRGAQVVAIDVDRLDAAQWPPLQRERLRAAMHDRGVQLGRGFAVAREALGSKVQRVVCDVHDLTHEAIGGPVDFAFAGALMLHLRDPVGALERVLGALVPGGRLLQMEPFSIRTTLAHPRRPIGAFSAPRSDFNWWMPNLSLLKAWPWAAGFVDVRLRRFVRPPSRREMSGWYAVLEGSRPR